MESVESQKQASPSFHEPLGNLAKDRRDFHIPTAPTTADGKVENQEQVSHFPTASIPFYSRLQTQQQDGLSPPAHGGAPRRLGHDIYQFGNIIS